MKSNLPKISTVISVHNEEHQLADCLSGLSFADEIVVLLDKCTDGSERIKRRREASPSVFFLFGFSRIARALGNQLDSLLNKLILF